MNVYSSENCSFQIVFSAHSYKCDLRIPISNCRKNKTETHTIGRFEKKLQYLPHYWSDKGFKGIVVNRALPPLHRRIFEIIAVSRFSCYSIKLENHRFFLWVFKTNLPYVVLWPGTDSFCSVRGGGKRILLKTK